MSGRQFPDFIEAYLAYTKSQEATERMHRWVAISMLAAAMERKVWLSRGHYVLYPNLYTIIVAPSGYKKSTSTGFGVNLLRELPTLKMMADRLTASSLIDCFIKAQRPFEFKGEPVKQAPSFAYVTEFLAFMKDAYGPLTEFLTTFYDCTPHDPTKPWIYSTKGEGERRVYGPCLNILAASTSSWLRQAIPVEQMEGGFTSRILFVVETDPPEKFVAFPEETQLLGEDYRLKLVADLTAVHNLVGPVSITEEARAWYRGWYEEHMKRLVKNTDLRFSGYYSRKSDTLLKLAMVSSVARSNDLLVSMADMTRALAWINNIELNMFQAFGPAGKNELSEMTLHVLNYMAQQEESFTGVGLPHQQILRAFYRNLDHAGLSLLMSNLSQMGLVTVITRTGQVCYLFAQAALDHIRAGQPLAMLLESESPEPAAGDPPSAATAPTGSGG